MDSFGNYLISLGNGLLTFTLVMYLIIGIVLRLLNASHYLKLSKAIWYLSAFTSALSGDKTETILMYLLLIEAHDQFFQFLEEKKKKQYSIKDSNS